MKIIVYFILLSVVLAVAMSTLFLVLKLAVVLFFYFKTNEFSFNVGDIADSVVPGCAIGVLLSLMASLAQYIKNKR